MKIDKDKENSNDLLNYQSDFRQRDKIQEIRRYGDFRQNTSVGFERANWQLAMNNKISRWNRYYKGQQVSYFVDLNHFKAYGPGIYLFFVFLKQLTILFLILSLISLVPILYNALIGTNYSNVGDGLQVYIGKLTIGNHKGITTNQASESQVKASLNNKLFNVIPDMVSAVTFFLFYLYWSYTRKKLTKQLKNQIKLPNYQTVELLRFPDCNQQQIFQFMSKFGIVKEVAVVKNYQQMIYLSREIYQLSLQLKETRLTEGKLQQQNPKIIKKISEMEKLLRQLKQEQNKMQQQILKYYITFQTVADRQNTLEIFRPYQTCCKCFGDNPPQELYLKGTLIRVQACLVQPGGIIWQNVHITWKTRWIRFLVQLLILLFMIILGFAAISLLNIAAPPVSNKNIDTSLYNQTLINRQSNNSIVQSWCLKNREKVLTLVQLKQKCQIYYQRYYIKILVSIGISVIIIIVRSIVRTIVIALAKFQRYKSHTEQSISIMTNLFVLYVCTSVLITLLLQANIFGISMKTIIRIFIPQDSYLRYNSSLIVQYNDFIGGWYLDIGYQLWMTWLILAFSPHCVWPLVQYIFEKYGEWKGKSEILQKNMQNRIQAQQFDIEDHYANIMMVIFIGFTFSGGIPLLIPLSFFALLTRYIVFKYSFIRFSRIPKTFDETLDSRMTQILPLSLLAHLCFSIWMYGVRQVFAFESNWMTNLISTSNYAFVSALVLALQRISQTWYMTVLLILSVIIIIFKAFLFDIVLKSCANKKKVPSAMLQTDLSSKIRSEISLTSSYKLQNNPDYFEILAIMNPKAPSNQ